MAVRREAGSPVSLGLCTEYASAEYSGRRGEDRTVTARLAQPVAGHVAHLLAVFDGHGGSAAARCTAAGVAPTLEAMLRPLSRPSAAAMDSCLFAAQLQEALVFTSLELHRCFAEAGCTSGCSATLLLVTGAHVTIASLGSSRCTLDAGNGELLDLTADHRISSNPRERLRLLESGCHVAPLATRGFGPALSSSAAAAAGGVLRLWPGGLALSRCIGDFAVGKAVLPLPHIKQVLLPPSGGRLVLATDGVWSQAGQKLLRVMHAAPLQTAALEAVRAVSTSRRSDVDASMVVVDVLPAGDSWQAVRQRQQAAAEAAQGPRHLSISWGSKTLLQMLGLGRRQSSPATDMPSAAGPHGPARPEMLADYDAAALLGLAPQGGSSSGSGSGSSSISSWDGKGSGWGSETTAAVEVPLSRQPLWFDKWAEAHMRALLAAPHQLWREARRRRRSALADTIVEQHSQGAVQAWWLEAAATAAMEAAATGAAPSPLTTPASSAPPSPAKQWASQFRQQHTAAPALGRPSPYPASARSSLLATAAAASRAATAGGALVRRSSSNPSDSRVGSMTRIEEEGVLVAARGGEEEPLPSPGSISSAASIDPLSIPRRCLPPLRTQSAPTQMPALRAQIAPVPMPVGAASVRAAERQQPAPHGALSPGKPASDTAECDLLPRAFGDGLPTSIDGSAEQFLRSSQQCATSIAS